MKIKTTRNVLIAGAHVDEGKVVDVSERDARYLIAIGKAVVAPAKAKAEKVETDEPEPEAEAEVDTEVEAEKADAAEAIISQAVPGGKRPARRK